ncbi:peptidoglycan DD-metalloendopeptidase family protein [Cytobacillus sp. Sa5YUA1]|uniref:Peptidoglycan DD-metalloendopeptidase family protein n=2 Tax=Cytobacillus stercorigallinarum TaxID=2762240 RepID=A0ABR8QWP9_9BACI|nr:peptidoglycan DD-metalloendopeptidase family protein [Cytobacillus stercorigallinarum]
MVLLLLGFMIIFMMMFGTMTDNNTGIIGGSISEIGENEIPADYLPIYQAAEEKYGVPWNLLAAHHRVETRFSTLEVMISPVGAIGHLQFMPLTWIGWSYPGGDRLGNADIPDHILTDPEMVKKYGGMGVDGNGDGKADPWDLEDAIFSAANYLAKNGAAEGDLQRAVYAYNHSNEYVNQVLYYADLYVEGYVAIDEVVAGESGFARPLDTTVTSEFGLRVNPITGESSDSHKGVDFACSIGQSIPAAKDGKVVYAGWQNPNNHKEGYGLYVWIDHGSGYKTTYAHLSDLNVSVGDTVKLGDKVGGCGSTGSSTGPHLHFEIFQNGVRVDPSPFIGL